MTINVLQIPRVLCTRWPTICTAGLTRKTEIKSCIYNRGNVIQGICHTGDMEEPRRQFSDITQRWVRAGNHSHLTLEKQREEMVLLERSVIWNETDLFSEAGSMQDLLLEEKYPGFTPSPSRHARQSLTSASHWLRQESEMQRVGSSLQW